MSEHKETNMQSEEYTGVSPQPEQVEEVEATVLSQSDDFEDEDELDRIPLETEPTMQEVLAEVQQSQTKQINRQASENVIEDRNVTPEKKEYGLGVTAMVLGILSLLLFCVPGFGLVLAAMAIVIGIVAAAKNNGKKMGTSGVIMGVISLATYLIIFLVFGGIFNVVNKNQDNLTDSAWRRTTDGSVLYLYSDGTFIDVEQEGVFTDNFYSGTYDILTYDESGVDFRGIENQYQTDYVYDVHLYVDTYVSDGVERDNIADTICYLYLFDKNYSDGEAVEVCAHDAKQYGTIYPVKETNMAYPGIGNQYVATEQGETDMESGDTATVTDAEGTTEEIAEATEDEATEAEGTIDTESTTGSVVNGDTESTTGSVVNDNTEVTTELIAETTTEIITETTTETTTETITEASTENVVDSDHSIWGDMEDFFEDKKEEFDEFSSSASEEFDAISSSASEEWDKNSEEISSVFDEASSAVEEASSAMEEASSVMEEASSAVEEIEENLDVNGIQNFFERIFNAIQDWLSKWGFN